jgi:Protein of unknown function (DUF2523)
MATFASFLLGITGSLAARVLFSLGFGFFSYEALTALASAVSTSVASSYSSMLPIPLAIINLAGAGQALGIYLASLTTRAALSAIKKLRPI